VVVVVVVVVQASNGLWRGASGGAGATSSLRLRLRHQPGPLHAQHRRSRPAPLQAHLEQAVELGQQQRPPGLADQRQQRAPQRGMQRDDEADGLRSKGRRPGGGMREGLRAGSSP
jgi:hypothetical protein